MAKYCIPYQSYKNIKSVDALPGEIITAYNEESHERILFMGTYYGTIGLIEVVDERLNVSYKGCFPNKLRPVVEESVFSNRLSESDIRSVVNIAFRQGVFTLLEKRNIHLTSLRIN